MTSRNSDFNNKDLNNLETRMLDLITEINNLERKKSNLIVEIDGLTTTASKMKDDQIKLEDKARSTIESARSEAQRIKDDASVLYDKVKAKEKELNDQIGSLAEKMKEHTGMRTEASDLIKSNEGLKNNLDALVSQYKEKMSKLNTVLKNIQDHINAS